jgi:Ca2+-binding RTX toxin-like protein
LATAQRADVQISGYIRDQSNTAQLGDAATYSIRIDRVLFGTTAADTITGDGVAGYIDARDGNDSVTGSAISEQIVGGSGDDTLLGMSGNDVLVDGGGRNSLSGGEGNDVIDVSATNLPTDTIDGGAGIDTLKVVSDTSWTGLTLSGVEILDGNSGRTSLTPQQATALGFTTAQNITFRLDPSLANGGTLDASGLTGNLNLRGTNQSDTLIGNTSNNTINLNSDQTVGAGFAEDTVQGGAGDDTIIWSTKSYQAWSQFFFQRGCQHQDLQNQGGS